MTANLSVLELFLVIVVASSRVDWFDFVPRFCKPKLNENWILNNVCFEKDVLIHNVGS